MRQQTTINQAVGIRDIGLHTGAEVGMTLRPAPSGHGVRFRRIDLIGDRDISLSPEAVVETRLGTTISNAMGAKVATVEHVLAAVLGMGVDNLLIEIDGPETPAMDGSSQAFVDMIQSVGVRTLKAPRQVLKVRKRVQITVDGKTAAFEPADQLELDIAIDYDQGAIGRQRVVYQPDPEVFATHIASARTFAFLNDVEMLRAAGLARGGSMANCIVLDDTGVVNPSGLRFDNEFARHKLLDALGDLALAGAPIRGRYVAERPGHMVNNLALRALLADADAWELVEEPVEPVLNVAAGGTPL